MQIKEFWPSKIGGIEEKFTINNVSLFFGKTQESLAKNITLAKINQNNHIFRILNIFWSSWVGLGCLEVRKWTHIGWTHWWISERLKVFAILLVLFKLWLGCIDVLKILRRRTLSKWSPCSIYYTIQVELPFPEIKKKRRPFLWRKSCCNYVSYSFDNINKLGVTFFFNSAEHISETKRQT